MVHDFVFIGAGAAGLSLALALLERFEDARALLVDPNLENLTHRTYAFWCEGAPPLRAAVSKTWTTVAIHTSGRSLVRGLEQYAYHLITGADFRDHCLARLAATGRADLSRTGAVSTHAHGDGVRVVFLEGETIGRWVFDSRFREEDVPIGPEHVALHQRFLGWDVRAAPGSFDPSVATLFDFRLPQADDQRFVYVLPTSDRTALVEHVSLQRCDHAAALEEYMRRILGIGTFEVTRKESGTSLLTDAPFVRRTGDRILRVGLAGGMLKPTSGYAFTRILADAEAITDSLDVRGHPFDLPNHPDVFAFMDRLFLELTQEQPEQMSEIFAAMFRYNPPDRIFAFLDENTSAEEIIKLGLGLPVGPFLRTAGPRFVPRLMKRLAAM